MSDTTRLPLAALLAASLLGFTACAETPSEKTETAPAVESTPSDKVAAPADKAADSGKAAAAKPADAGSKEAAAPEATKPSAEEQAKAEIRRRVDRMTLEKLRIDAGLELAALKMRKARAEENAERARIDTEAALRASKTAAENQSEEEARADSERRVALADAKSRLDQLEASNRARILETDTKLAKQEVDNRIARLGIDAARLKRELATDKVADTGKNYLANPYVEGVLHISDRLIRLNGPILDGVALNIAERIAFYNKRDPKAPIFIVISNSPGGSGMAGYQIIKAMQGSKAPVHVVLTGSATNLAASIVALAPHSYCSERALLCHNQSASQIGGTLVGMRERLDFHEKWYRRINEPVASRMGISMDEFVKRMHEKNAKGEWMEFGSDARKLKWVDHVVEKIVDESVDTLVDVPSPSTMAELMGGDAGLVPSTDTAGRVYYTLPPLSFGDTWMIDTREGLYRFSL